MKDRLTVVAGRVAYDVENAEWVMFVDDRFVPAGALYAGINEQLSREGHPPLADGDGATGSRTRVNERAARSRKGR